MSRPRNQHGFTLVELIVVAGLFGVIALVFGNFTVRSLQSYQYLQAQSYASGDLTGIVGRVSKVVRGTTDIVTAQATTITIYAYFSPNDAVVDKVCYFTTGNTLSVGVTPPTGTAPTYTYNPANEKITVLSRDLTMGSTPIFTYYDDLGNQLPAAFTLSQVREIGINLMINPDPNRLKTPVGNQTIVSLRNKKTNL